MANKKARVPKTIKVKSSKRAEFGRYIAGLALMDPAELSKRAGTVAALKENFKRVADCLDFDNVADDHTIVFDQGSETEHRFSLPALYKLLPIIVEYYEMDPADLVPDGETIRTDVSTDLADYDAFLRPPLAFEEGYPLPDFFRRAVCLPPTDDDHLSDEDPERFYQLAGYYTFQGCRG